jgi:hypothetical protein
LYGSRQVHVKELSDCVRKLLGNFWTCENLLNEMRGGMRVEYVRQEYFQQVLVKLTRHTLSPRRERHVDWMSSEDYVTITDAIICFHLARCIQRCLFLMPK